MKYLIRRCIIFFLCFYFPLICSGQPSATIIKNVNLFDGENYFKNVNVVFHNGTILEISEKIKERKDAIIIDGTNKTILPPLLDAHVHVWFPAHLQEALKAGIFGVLDMHTSDEGLKWLKLYNDSTGYAHYYSSGPGATVKGGHGTQFGIPVPMIGDSLTPEKFVNDRVKNNADYIKILREPLRTTITFKQTEQIIKTAHENSKLAVAHVSRLNDALVLSRQGVDGFVHIWFDKSIAKEQLDSMKMRKNFIVPTLSVTEKALALSKTQGWSQYVLTFDKVLEETKKAYDAGISILAGTDAPNFELNYGDALYDEMLLLSKAGLTNIEVLKSATSNIYKSFMLKEFGKLEKGKSASFIIVDGSPMEKIEEIKNKKTIIQKGFTVKN